MGTAIASTSSNAPPGVDTDVLVAKAFEWFDRS